MSRINSVKMISDDKLSKYYYILYGLNFMKDVLEQEPGLCYVSDATKMWHMQVEENKLKNVLFYRYGYLLQDLDEKLWKVLSEIDKNIKVQLPADLYAFWAIPSRFCVSHSHPAKDVFRIEALAQRIAAKEFDLIIELRSRDKDGNHPNHDLFNKLAKEYESNEFSYTYVIPDDEDFGVNEIESIIAKIDRYLGQGKKVLLHSQGRTDRLALALAAWLVQHKLADETNFIEKIAQLRLGFFIVGENGDPRDRWEINKYFEYNCDETRTVYPTKQKYIKARIRASVPFYFSKAKQEEINYWIQSVIPVDYDVDAETLEVIKHFGKKK